MSAPRLAFKLGAAVAQDCVEGDHRSELRQGVSHSPGCTAATPMAKVSFAGDGTQVVVVRPKTFETLEPDASRGGEVTDFPVEIDDSAIKVRLVETVTQESEGVRLEDAGIVVASGRGLGGPEPFETLQEFSQLLGGALGASRAACDAGWIDHSHQVGLTGKTITPDPLHHRGGYREPASTWRAAPHPRTS